MPIEISHAKLIVVKMLKKYNLKCKKCNSKQVFGGYVENDKERPFFLCLKCIWKADERTPDDWKVLLT